MNITILCFVLGWLLICAWTAIILLVVQQMFFKEDFIWLIPTLFIGPLVIVIAFCIIRPIRKYIKYRKRKKAQENKNNN